MIALQAALQKPRVQRDISARRLSALAFRSLLAASATLALSASAVADVIPQQHALQTSQSFPAQPTPALPSAATTASTSDPAAPQQPTATTVDWDSHKLRIVANDASLADILKEVSSKTGAALRGVDADQRIFGTYGPGPARDVLSQLLEGSGYNVMIIGDQGHGAPRFIVLSARPAPSAQTARSYAPSAPNDDNAEAQPDPPEPEPAPVAAPPPPQPQNNPAPGTTVKTPQEMMQEMQQRLLQLQQMQQSGQPQTQPQ